MKINPKFRLYDIAGEKVIIIHGKPEDYLSRIITLNATSEWLWNCLVNENFSLEKITGLLMEHFEVTPDIARKDADSWINQLKANGIIE